MSDSEETPEAVEEFIQSKESGESMVHRLRNWRPGDTVYGWDTLSDNGSMGKTFRGGDDGLTDDPEGAARDGFEGAVDGPLSSDTNDVFLWRATVESVRTDPPNPDGEPPLKFAHLSDVRVLDYRLGAEGDA